MAKKDDKKEKDKHGDKKKDGNKHNEVAPLPGLYTLALATLHTRPHEGPLVEPTYNIPKASGQKDFPLGVEWMNYLGGINNEVAYGRIIAPDWGPSKGINDKGLLKFNALVYPGRNIVRILQVELGKDKAYWGLVDTLDANQLPVLPEPGSAAAHPEYDAPHHYHTVYSCAAEGSYFLQPNAPVVPLLSKIDDNHKKKNKDPELGQWIQMEKLKAISLPVTVTVTAPDGVSLYLTPGDFSSQSGSLACQATMVIGELRIATGGIWGGDGLNWLALRLNDLNTTDWLI